MITENWRDRFREGIDYEVLRGKDLQDFKELSTSRGEGSWTIHPSTPQLMILYTSGVDLVLVNTEKRVGDTIRRWLVDEVFPSLRATGIYAWNPADRRALPAVALFNAEIRKTLSKFRNACIASQSDHVTRRDYTVTWDETHKAHTAPLSHEKGYTAKQIKAIARQRGIKGLSSKSARDLMYEMPDFRHTNISESAEIDLERIGVARQRARQIAITDGQPYFKALVAEGVDQASLGE